ncbi:gliding motility-associated ABC transporter substrate-binding protein GldG [Salinimicrobium sp. GXAS 041]|uniref:gliding motility-associated ABC transporter substrate-binding protein GldG n=1 Tax=Salinimicrobium sp. GXAS 041 TaxID=3400806 RepID=UPI003C7698F3
MKKKRSNMIKGIGLFAVLLLINVISYNFFDRYDLTEDERYTLSPAAKEIIADVETPIIIDVFLKGDFPPEFRKLQIETRQLLEEFEAYNSSIQFNFVNPLAEGGDANQIATEFYEMGMTPARINVVENGRSSEAIIFPWAMANYRNQTVAIPLLKNKIGATTEERVENSVQQLEYAFADAFSKLVNPKRKKVAVMRGNGELEDAFIADFIKSLQDYYFIAPFTLDSVASDPQKTLNDLQEYDLIIEAKPTEAYTEAEKFVLDQYTMNGGKALWLVDQVAMETDSLFSPSGAAFALPRDLNLDDYFFKYGVRINPVLVKDIFSAPIILASGSGNNTSFNPYPWFYYPLSSSPGEHSIINNIEAVKFEYASPIDTLFNNIKKTVLLSSSPSTQLEGTPAQISLEQIKAEPHISEFTAGEQPFAVLLEGKFRSVYKNRIKPFSVKNPVEQGKETKMLIISDGNVIKNELQRGTPLELGFDQYTGNTYGNKEFLMNAVNYLLDDNGLIDIRSKQVSIAFLDLQKADNERLLWQVINVLLPVLVLAVFATGFLYFRKRKYIKK